MPTKTPRYLAAFHPKHLPHYFVDVLIIGGGLAGLRAAIEIDPSLRILVITFTGYGILIYLAVLDW